MKKNNNFSILTNYEVSKFKQLYLNTKMLYLKKSNFSNCKRNFNFSKLKKSWF